MRRYEPFAPWSLVVTKNALESGDQSSSQPTPGPRSTSSDPMAPLTCKTTFSSFRPSMNLARTTDFLSGDQTFSGLSPPDISDHRSTAFLLNMPIDLSCVPAHTPLQLKLAATK